jgi:hypothetical protein
MRIVPDRVVALVSWWGETGKWFLHLLQRSALVAQGNEFVVTLG